MDTYLRTFEKLARLYEWPKENWATRLVPLLSGKALETFSRLDPAESENYDLVKRAILKRNLQQRHTDKSSDQAKGKVMKLSLNGLFGVLTCWIDGLRCLILHHLRSSRKLLS